MSSPIWVILKLQILQSELGGGESRSYIIENICYELWLIGQDQDQDLDLSEPFPHTLNWGKNPSLGFVKIKWVNAQRVSK